MFLELIKKNQQSIVNKKETTGKSLTLLDPTVFIMPFWL